MDRVVSGSGTRGAARAAGAPVVRARELRRDFRLGAETVHALRGVSLEIGHGDYVSVVGPSGCGKSTLLNLLGVVDSPTSGSLEIAGREVAAMRDREVTEFRLRRIGFVFQRFYLMPTLTASENVQLPMAEAGLSRAARTARAGELLEYVGLGARARHRPSELSGGEQQRVAIARALANSPALLLADEPTGELDAVTGREIVALFERLNADGATVIVVTHDEALAHAAHRTLQMRDGCIVEDRMNRAPRRSGIAAPVLGIGS